MLLHFIKTCTRFSSGALVGRRVRGNTAALASRTHRIPSTNERGTQADDDQLLSFLPSNKQVPATPYSDVWILVRTTAPGHTSALRNRPPLRRRTAASFLDVPRPPFPLLDDGVKYERCTVKDGVHRRLAIVAAVAAAAGRHLLPAPPATTRPLSCCEYIIIIILIIVLLPCPTCYTIIMK